MKRYVLVLAVCLAPFVQVLAQSQPVPEIPFESVPDFLKLPPDIYLGEAAGVAVNSKGHIFVFSRGNSTGRRMERRGAVAGVWSGRQVSARDWAQFVCVVVRARGEGG